MFEHMRQPDLPTEFRLSADYVEDEGALCWQKAYGQHPRQEIVIRYPADETWPVTIRQFVGR